MRWSRLRKIGTVVDRVSILGDFKMKNLVSRFISDESGVTAIEYGLIAALIAVVIIGAVSKVGSNLSTTFSSVAGSL